MEIASHLITYLFAKGEPVKHTELARFFDLDESSLASALKESAHHLENTGLALIDDGKEVEMRTALSGAALVEKIRKDEFSKDVGRAGLETLAIILYKGASSRSEIDFVRGVNSTYILRSLMMRGLVRRVPHPSDERSFRYEPTTELLAHLGVERAQDIPAYAEIQKRIEAIEEVAEQSKQEEQTQDA